MSKAAKTGQEAAKEEVAETAKPKKDPLEKLSDTVNVVGKCADVADKVFSTGFKIVEMFKSKPKIVVNNLKELNRKSEEAHKEMMGELNTAKKDMEKAIEDSKKAADAQLKEIRDQNEKNIQEMTKKIYDEQQKFDEEMTQRNKEHAEKMEMLRGESKEARDAAELKYKMEMEKLKKEHDIEKTKRNEQLDKIKQEGADKIEAAYKEKEELEKKRGEELDTFYKEMNQIMIEHEKDKNEIREKQLELRNQMYEETKKQMEVEYKQQMEQMDQLTNKIHDQIKQDATKSSLTQFLEIMKPVHDTLGALKNVETYCITDTDSSSESSTASIEVDLKTINGLRKSFNNKVDRFYQHTINVQNLAQREVLDACRHYITKLEEPMDSQEISTLCAHLPRAIENQNHANIRRYGEYAAKLSNQITTVRKELRNELANFTSSSISPPTAQGALKN